MSDEVKKPREVWVTRHEESIDMDKLTHIALMEYYPEQNPMHFIEHSAYTDLLREAMKLREALTDINRVELNSQRPGGGHSQSARISYDALANFNEFIKDREAK